MDKNKRDFGVWYLDNNHLYIICHTYNGVLYMSYQQACKLNDIEGDKVYFTLKDNGKDKFTKGYTMDELKYKYDNGLIYRVEKDSASTKLYVKEEDFDIDRWTLDKAKKDYQECNPVVIERNCCNCEFYGYTQVGAHTDGPIDEYVCMVTEKDLITLFNGIRAKRCKYYTQRRDL